MLIRGSNCAQYCPFEVFEGWIHIMEGNIYRSCDCANKGVYTYIQHAGEI